MWVSWLGSGPATMYIVVHSLRVHCLLPRVQIQKKKRYVPDFDSTVGVKGRKMMMQAIEIPPHLNLQSSSQC